MVLLLTEKKKSSKKSVKIPRQNDPGNYPIFQMIFPIRNYEKLNFLQMSAF